MPEGFLQIVMLLAFGYLLLFLELFLPGGVLGILGGVSIAYACYLAFGLSAGWGMATLVVSFVVAGAILRLVVRSRVGKNLMMVGDEGAKGWTAIEGGLDDLVGEEGQTTTPLRPAGLAQIGERRVDVVSDNEFLDAGMAVRVVEVEGNRVVVEAVESDEPSGETGESETAGA